MYGQGEALSRSASTGKAKPCPEGQALTPVGFFKRLAGRPDAAVIDRQELRPPGKA